MRRENERGDGRRSRRSAKTGLRGKPAGQHAQDFQISHGTRGDCHSRAIGSLVRLGPANGHSSQAVLSSRHVSPRRCSSLDPPQATIGHHRHERHCEPPSELRPWVRPDYGWRIGVDRASLPERLSRLQKQPTHRQRNDVVFGVERDFLQLVRLRNHGQGQSQRRFDRAPTCLAGKVLRHDNPRRGSFGNMPGLGPSAPRAARRVLDTPGGGRERRTRFMPVVGARAQSSVGLAEMPPQIAKNRRYGRFKHGVTTHSGGGAPQQQARRKGHSFRSGSRINTIFSDERVCQRNHVNHHERKTS